MENQKFNRYDFDSDYVRSTLTMNQYMARTFGWMFIGLMVTFLMAAVLAVTGLVYVFFSNSLIPVFLLIAEMVVVLAMSTNILNRSVGATRMLFTLYSILNGIVFSVYFAIFEVINLILIFALTALFFGGFALYGRFTRTDLSGLRPLLLGGLIFLIIAGLLTMFIDLSALERVITMVGIVVFLCFTAYDTQKIKANYEYFYGDEAMLQKASVFSALQLYLDFVNLFLYLLRFVGRGRNSR